MLYQLMMYFASMGSRKHQNFLREFGAEKVWEPLLQT